MQLTPTAGAAATRLQFAATQRGQAVKGTVTVARPGSRLKIELLRGKTRVGAGTKTVNAGYVSFSVNLNSAAKKTLRRARKLKLTVKLTVTPVTGTPFTATKTVTLRAR